jgi:hypothetical protein
LPLETILLQSISTLPSTTTNDKWILIASTPASVVTSEEAECNGDKLLKKRPSKKHLSSVEVRTWLENRKSPVQAPNPQQDLINRKKRSRPCGSTKKPDGSEVSGIERGL